MYEPCLCGADDCPACFPGRAYRRYPLGSLDAEDIDILNEQAAADEEAALTSRRMREDEDEAYRAEQAAHAADAERWYADNDTPPVEHDLF